MLPIKTLAAVLTLSTLLNSSAFGSFSSNLKSAIKFKRLIIFGIFYSASSNCFPALALTTYTLNYSSDNPSNSLSGSLTIDETDPAAQGKFTPTSIPSFVSSLTYTETVGATQTLTSLTNGEYSYIYWEPITTLDFTQDLVTQMNGLTFFSSDTVTNPLNALSSFMMTNSVNRTTYTMNSALPSAASVPGPLPILGLPAVLFYSRRLKKRIKASKELSSASLV